MNADTLNSKLQQVIRNELQDDVNIANFLADTLYIGKEAAHRRLRGTVMFSLYEVALISKKLGISIDHVVGTSPSDSLIFELKEQSYYDLQKSDYKSFKEFYNMLKIIAQDPESELVVSSNIFPQLPTQIFYQLCKYNSFKWMYLHQEIYPVKRFDEIDYPQELYNMHRDSAYETMNIKNSCYIWDSMIFESIVKELKYFSNIYLINKADIQELKKELYQLLDYFEEIAIKGEFETGNKINIYISNINMDTVYGYIKSNHLQLSMIGAFTFNYLGSFDKTALTKINEKVSSLKRVSTLISGSGESHRIVFFKKQRELVNTI